MVKLLSRLLCLYRHNFQKEVPVLHRFYVGSRGSYAAVLIDGQDKKEAVRRLLKMTDGEVPFLSSDQIYKDTSVIDRVLDALVSTPTNTFETSEVSA